MKTLVGHTGFVGSNLVTQTQFDAVYNSKTIEQAFDTRPDLLVYSGVRAEKFLANSNPEQDFDIVQNALHNIKRIDPKNVVLISTVDVYPSPIGVDESIDVSDLDNQAYGKNRLWLEQQLEANFENHLILRLPALFGPGLKKNFIYDLIHVVPSMLNSAKFEELSQRDQMLKNHYDKQENGFYKLSTVSDQDKKMLKERFLNLGFSALNFTDSRGIFQFYNLDDLWFDMQIALSQGLKKLNMATEPISVNEIYESVFSKPFDNEILPTPPRYDFYTLHGAHFCGHRHYIRQKKAILEGIQQFIQAQQ